MVVFSCDGCGEMLKKSKVNLHAQRCRRCHSVSCIDCSVSFYGDDFRSHTSCISEAERYEKTMYKGKKNSKKKNPQEAWMDLIQSTANDAPTNIRHYMQQLASLENCPRKEKQFRNFAVNSLKLRGNSGNAIVDDIWNYLSQQRQQQQQQQQQQEQQQKEQQQQEQMQTLEKTEEQSENKSEEQTIMNAAKNEESTETMNASDLNPKVVKKAMKKVLKKAPSRSMKVKSLRREVGDKLGVTGNESLKLLKKLLKQQIGTDKIKLDGKTVSLIK